MPLGGGAREWRRQRPRHETHEAHQGTPRCAAPRGRACGADEERRSQHERREAHQGTTPPAAPRGRACGASFPPVPTPDRVRAVLLPRTDARSRERNLERTDHASLAHALLEAIKERDRKIEDLEAALEQQQRCTGLDPEMGLRPR